MAVKKKNDNEIVDDLMQATLEDPGRRELMARLAKASAAAVPVSMVLMSKARAQDSGTGAGFGL